MDVSIYGYTDNQGWRNSTAEQSRQKNLNLSQERAPSVACLLSTSHGWGIREGFLYKNEMLDELTAWLRSFKAPRKDAVRVACIGNSITYGARIKNRNRDSYPSVLGRMLGDGYWVKMCIRDSTQTAPFTVSSKYTTSDICCSLKE